MIVPHDMRTAGARGLVRRQQDGRIQLEMARRIRRDIGGEANIGDPAALAQQQSAALHPLSRRGIGKDQVEQGS